MADTVDLTSPSKRKRTKQTTLFQFAKTKPCMDSSDSSESSKKSKTSPASASSSSAVPIPASPAKLLAPLPAIASNLTCASWFALLQNEFAKPYFQQIAAYLKKEVDQGHTVYPPSREVFSALNLTPIESVKVVIIGQDPYHGAGQAHGLSFSVKPGVRIPPSLRNIYKELESDVGFKSPSHGFLEPWARQGVLLLNATLTVQASKANSHAKIGWQTFTDAIIKLVSDRKDHVVFVLWGNFAQKKAEKIIDSSKHTVIRSAHPSPLSVRLFTGSKPFSKTNDALRKHGATPIDWTLPLEISA
mmetsp:Transcript_34333/g.86171  ORF Transcript_34333/g.86171 Transcript_34333/m.86171 type:complete len:302 (-) Transcript_34333:28-933(-)